MAALEPRPALDEMDARVVAAVQRDPRASYAQLAAMIGASETTVQRRLQRLRSSGAIVVIGVVDAQMCGLGDPALVYLSTEPRATLRVAHTLAARPDVRFVCIVNGHNDIVCELIVRDRTHLANVLLAQLSAIDGVRSTSTAIVLRTYKTRDEWSRDLLAGAGAGAGAPEHDTREAGSRRRPLDDLDQLLIAALREDGRRSYVDLSAELGISETAVARRLRALMEAGQVGVTALVDPLVMGFGVEGFLHFKIDPSRIESVARFLSRRREVRWLAATAGRSDLTCEAIFRDNSSLHEFITGVIGDVMGIREFEVDLELQTIKRAFRLLVEPDPLVQDAQAQQAIA
jgi:DNA-binding Lrp family transcriptional regulator